jgi:hypothetical protein
MLSIRQGINPITLDKIRHTAAEHAHIRFGIVTYKTVYMLLPHHIYVIHLEDSRSQYSFIV